MTLSAFTTLRRSRWPGGSSTLQVLCSRLLLGPLVDVSICLT